MIIKSVSEYQQTSTWVAQPADDWSNLFNRITGWTGADGIYSIPVSGKEIFDDYGKEKTVFLFSDTFISEVDDKNRRHNNTMINNSIAVLEGSEPLPENVSFHWDINEKKEPVSIFSPDLAYNKESEWFWLMDGISIGSQIHIFALKLQENPHHIFNFRITGVSFLTTSLNGQDRIGNYSQQDIPLFYKGSSDNEDIVFGQAIMPFTQRSQNPDADGYIYIYGPRGALIEKEMLVARVKENSFLSISEWRFWNGSDWSPSMEDCSAITKGISQEFSVTPLGNNQFIVVFLREQKVGIRLGTSPVGPFGPINYIWDCREADNDPDVYVYNAKAHPHLSKPGELLISYNVNCHTLQRHDKEADLYHPRFISLKLGKGAFNVA